VYGGAEVVGLLKTGSALVALAASVTAMVRALLSEQETILPSCVYLDGQFGIDDVYLSVPASLNNTGVVRVEEVGLSDTDLARLQASAETVSATLDSLGLRG